MTQTNYDALYEARDGAVYRVKMDPVLDQSGVAPEHRVYGGTSTATVVDILSPNEHSESEYARGEKVTDIMPRFRKLVV